jgi:hypothetical protein
MPKKKTKRKILNQVKEATLADGDGHGNYTYDRAGH